MQLWNDTSRSYGKLESAWRLSTVTIAVQKSWEGYVDHGYTANGHCAFLNVDCL